MSPHHNTRLLTASVFAIALVALAACDDNATPQGSAGDVEQTGSITESQANPPVVVEPTTPPPAVD